MGSALSRRDFLKLASVLASASTAGPALLASGRSHMGKVERVRAALRGERVDRVPFTCWHHFGLEKLPGEKHAEATLDFYRKFDVDLLKVMSDSPYPPPEGLDKISEPEDWQRLEPLKNPFPEQIKALRLINKELKGQALFVETIFQSWNVAEKLSSKKDLAQLKENDPKLFKTVLRAISESQVNHARLALDAGAAGIFLAVSAADHFVTDPQDYVKMGRESDLIILEAVRDKSILNVLHVHGNKPHWDTLVTYPVQVMNYSAHGTGIGLSDIRRKFTGTLMGGLNEGKIASQMPEELANDVHAATLAMQKRRFILSPGCSVPNDISAEVLLRLRELVQKS
ncbi:MAG: twin-arginine translocation signal domain-containing protein [Acidobacteria bacterium]|nr:twin-arginine translocation signal domain-containing protein [Acidobacteriota bacterium]MCI0621361.1 twin-arginine translocation signal domain-containing protein [Acidobacteriota bacterium]MCI0720092.1 twin-arginine translocation signal domain-containing protein [Acidobacteriota bacterium]